MPQTCHDLCSGPVAGFFDIPATVDRSVPSGSEWHRDLFRQMQMTLSPPPSPVCRR